MNCLNARKLRHESLEERALLAVTAGGFEQVAAIPEPAGATGWIVNTLDDATDWDTADDILSLREAIARTQTGDTITFDERLADGTITLCGSQLNVYRGITIDASEIGGITIDANGKSGVFYVSGGDETNPVELIGLTVTGGNSGYGGGIYNEGTLTITNSTISGNTASRYGGGIYNYYGTLTITNSTISGNTANYYGGGISNSGTLTITNSTISGNTASRYGGGIYNYKGTLTITNSTFFGNAASYDGGGIYKESGTLTITNSTISGNTASYGGGIRNYYSGTLTLTNTIISLNYARYHGNDVHGSYSGSNNIVGNDPGFVVAPVFDESGVLTNADTLDLSLTARSAAIDAGTNDAVTTEYDIVRNPRIVAASTDVPVVDIGAYEYQGHVSRETSSTVVTTNLDITDLTDGLISLREAILYAETGGRITFDSSLSGQTIVLSSLELTIAKGITIDASGVGGITIDADGASRVFNIIGGDETNPVELIGLTVTGGNSGKGGGISNSGTLTITNSTISGNTASDDGGGIYNESGTLTITNSTISGNTASDDGGGIGNDGTLMLTNSIVSLNYAFYDSNISFNGTISGSNIIGLDPGFVVAPIFENGILVNADELDLSLTAQSIAIDAGTNSAVDTDTDLAGNPRIYGGIVDIGAYEYQGTPSPAPTEQLSVPTITTGKRGIYLSYGANRHNIQWGAVANASGYEVQYSTDGANWATVSASGLSAVITGLTYGADVAYRVRALGTGSYTDSPWSAVKIFNVCPMDVNGDGDISGADRVYLHVFWLTEEGNENYLHYADINGDGEVSNMDRVYISRNWMKEAGDDDLVYPKLLRAAEVVFAAYESGDMDADINVF